MRPYVDRFACDWHRLAAHHQTVVSNATTDPGGCHTPNLPLTRLAGLPHSPACPRVTEETATFGWQPRPRRPQTPLRDAGQRLQPRSLHRWSGRRQQRGSAPHRAPASAARRTDLRRYASAAPSLTSSGSSAARKGAGGSRPEPRARIVQHRGNDVGSGHVSSPRTGVNQDHAEPFTHAIIRESRTNSTRVQHPEEF